MSAVFRFKSEQDHHFARVTYTNWNSYYVQTVGFCEFESRLGHHLINNFMQSSLSLV